MFSYLRDKYRAARVGARYQRLVQEKLLALAEQSGPEWVGEEPDAADWTLVGPGWATISEQDRVDARQKARELAAKNPHARNVLRLMEVYVVGPGLAVQAVAAGAEGRGRRTEGREGSGRVSESASQRVGEEGSGQWAAGSRQEGAGNGRQAAGSEESSETARGQGGEVLSEVTAGQASSGTPSAVNSRVSILSDQPLTLDAQPSTLKRLAVEAGRLWEDFVRGNRRHWSYREHARRTWRDGECFVRKFRQATWPPEVRFLDPEAIGEPHGAEGTKGIVTDPRDAERPVAYLYIDPASGRLREEIAAEEILHTKIGADSNQKRGVTIFLPVADALKRFEGWMETELIARKLQASIVLWRKVKGSPTAVAGLADAAQSGSTTYREGALRREKIRPGTILTTSAGTELQFLHPETNIGEAVPLGRLILLCIAAGQGLPEFMLTSDASNANYASTMVAEAPAVKMFQAEQQFFIAEFDDLWRWVMGEAVRLGLLPVDFFRLMRAHWTAPDLVSRNRPKERLADVRLVGAGILSRQEVARREGVDPEVMAGELGAGEVRPGGIELDL
ncbi:MAG: phage portal protein [Planctomycetes bacterium]|nr:phage portal protein [Planctomycetota bacterium]